jgi:hypothetical protein
MLRVFAARILLTIFGPAFLKAPDEDPIER